MNVEDLTKAMWMLNGDSSITAEISKIQFGVISMTDGTEYYLEDLVAAYDKEYGG